MFHARNMPAIEIIRIRKRKGKKINGSVKFSQVVSFHISIFGFAKQNLTIVSEGKKIVV